MGRGGAEALLHHSLHPPAPFRLLTPRMLFGTKVEVWETSPGVHTHGYSYPRKDVPLCLPDEGLCLSVVSGWGLKREGLVQPLPPPNTSFYYSNPPCPCCHPCSNLIAARSLALDSTAEVLSLWGPQVCCGPGCQMHWDSPSVHEGWGSCELLLLWTRLWRQLRQILSLCWISIS